MLKRLGLGLLKGLLIGGAIGAGLQYGLHWTDATGLLGFLLSMGVAGTAGVFAGKAPWREGAWIEATLKGMVGVGLGALAYWGLTYLTFGFPFPGLEGTHTLASLPVVFAPAIAGVYGSLVELDDTGEDGDAAKTKKKSDGPKARVDVGDDDEVEEDVGRKRRDRRRKA
ncbi:MAG: hypothetical protein H6719_13665 [Sandaracinaceae bacterium]|nr:hypothetical protein [Sandaracinaceae bacterium]